MSIYRVTGNYAYRSHNPGETFEAVLDAAAEARAIKRGAIELVKRDQPKVQTGTYQLPKKRTRKRTK